MKSTDIPAKFQIPFANSAVSPYINPIPLASQVGIVDGAASLTTGFPVDCFSAVGAGGVPPFGADFNGLLKQVTAWNRWQAAGGPVFFDAGFVAVNGGYPKGAVLKSTATAPAWWVSTLDDNVTDPDGGSPVGWQLQITGQLLNVRVFSAGTFTYNPTFLGTRSIIIELLSGGGAGGSCPPSVGNHFVASAPGMSGCYARARYTTAFSGIGLVVGDGGVHVPLFAGTDGGNSAFGSLLGCVGGKGGDVSAVQTIPVSRANTNNPSQPTGSGIISTKNSECGTPSFIVNEICGFGGAGGSSPFGPGGPAAPVLFDGNTAGQGGGGSGAASFNSANITNGGNGGPGLAVIWEYD